MTRALESLPSAGGPVELPVGEVHLWTVRCGQSSGELPRLAEGLPTEEQERAAGIAAPLRRQHFILGRALLRNLLERYLGPNRRRDRIEILSAGKPVLADPEASLHFNLAHSEDIVAVALSAADPVGIDVERIRPIAQRAGIAERYFNAEERRQVELAEEDPDATFFFLWTAREAMVKATGLGISRGWAASDGPEDGVVPWSILRPHLAFGYSVAVAVPRAQAALRSFQWNPRDEVTP